MIGSAPAPLISIRGTLGRAGGGPGNAEAREPADPTLARPRTSWIDEGLRALAAGGPDAVRVEAGGGDARARLRRLFGLASSVADLLDIELAIRDWARRDPGVAERLRRVDNRRMDYMRGLFGARYDDPDDVEVRCLLVLSLFIGNHFIAADHGARTRDEVLELTVRWLDSSLPARRRGTQRQRR